ncbi:hypothetical protein KAR91_53605 [Candidatus Pacearchaeota archaeon]|nr:hypothetical protein [Candidatus Pacearchaeota archaeon]
MKKYYPFDNKKDLVLWIKALDDKKPVTELEAIWMVLAKWHKENPERGEHGECGACTFYGGITSQVLKGIKGKLPDCTKCFMLHRGYSCFETQHPFYDEDNEDQIFSIALKAWEGLK